MILVTDWGNDAVHRVGLDGSYQGSFLTAEGASEAKISATLRMKPAGLIAVADDPLELWLLADRGITAWNSAGAPLRVVFFDTSVLETPTCAVRVGDRVFVASPDKKDMHVFDLRGAHVGSFGFPKLYAANDCKLGPDGMIYVGSTLAMGAPGLVAIWDPSRTGPDVEPVGYRIPGSSSGDETFWVHGLAFDDDGKLLVTELSRGRLERWDLETNSRVEILLDSDSGGAYAKLERGPDGLVYMAGSAGIYRFDARSTAQDLAGLEPFFDAAAIEDRFAKPFTPAGMTFVRADALAPTR